MSPTGSATPLVTVGVAVYNGENFLREALDSIVSQTYRNLDIVICDNASTDATAEICGEYAARDARIRYVRNSTNIGGARNENLTCALAAGQFFHFAAHDDVCDPTLIERCVELMAHRPDVVLVYPGIRKIDDRNVVLSEALDTRGLQARPHERLKSLYLTAQGCEIIYGLVRVDALRRSDLQHNYTDSDRSLLCQLALFGPFARVPAVLFSKRIHDEMSVKKFPEWRSRMAWFGDDVASAPTMPNWLQFTHLLSIVRRAPLDRPERARCYLAMIEWVGRERRWRRLLKDLYLAARARLDRRSAGGVEP